MPRSAEQKPSIAGERPIDSSGRINYTYAAIAVMVLAASLRLIGLNSNPPGINQDEAERAYDAYCLRAVGQDHLGTPWPIFFRAFGKADYPPGTYIYLLIPFQAVFGMNVGSTRLPAALLGTLNVWWLYLLVKRIYGDRAAFWAALLLAVSPWQMHLSRLAFEVSLCPPLVTLGFLLLTPTDHSRRRWLRLTVSGISFGLALWTYNAFRVVVPLLLMGAAIIYAKQTWRFIAQPRGRRGAAAWLIGILVGMSPFIWATIQSPAQTWARASVTTIFGQNASLAEKTYKVCSNYVMHLSPNYLFFTGDTSIVHGLTHYGKLHYFCLLLLPLGLFRAVARWRTERFGILLVWWTLIAPIPAAVTDVTSAHTLRSAGAVPAYEILSAIGLDLILAAAQRRSRAGLQATAACSAAFIALNVGYYLYQYHVRYPKEAASTFQAEWANVFQDLRRHDDEYAAMLLTSTDTKQLGMLYLFYNRIDPKLFLAEPRSISQSDTWDFIIHIGKYYFLRSSNLIDIAQQHPAGSKFLVVERPKITVPGVALQYYYYPFESSREPVLVLYEVTTQVAPL